MEPNWIRQRAYLTPNKVGLSFEKQQWTFKQLNEIATMIAGQLATNGIYKGMRIALIGPSSPQLVHIIYGCMQANVEIVFLNNRLTKDELAYQIADSDVNTIFYDEIESEKIAVFTHAQSFSDLLTSKVATIDEIHQWDESFTTSIMYTSGTTGYPKGVRQTLANHKASAIGSALNMGVSPNDVWLCAVPIFHISGFSMLMKSILYGVTLRLYAKFQAGAAVKEIVEGTVTHMSVVGVTLGQIVTLMEKEHVVASDRFQLMLAGGGPIATEYLKRANSLHLHVAQTYGMTETASQTATLSNADALTKLGAAGKPLFFNEVKIEGATKPFDEGEILIKGPHVTPGYIGHFKNRAAQIDGWLHSGDIGYLDDEGYLYVVDRRSDLIISGGENIYPAEIENILLAHPSVREAGVCGIEHPKWGQVPAAFLVLNTPTTSEELRMYCEGKLAKYKVPSAFYFVESLPRTGSNKLMRRKLHEFL